MLWIKLACRFFGLRWSVVFGAALMSSWPCGCRCYLGRVGALFGFFFVQKLIVSDKKGSNWLLILKPLLWVHFFTETHCFCKKRWPLSLILRSCGPRLCSPMAGGHDGDCSSEWSTLVVSCLFLTFVILHVVFYFVISFWTLFLFVQKYKPRTT